MKVEPDFEVKPDTTGAASRVEPPETVGSGLLYASEKKEDAEVVIPHQCNTPDAAPRPDSTFPSLSGLMYPFEHIESLRILPHDSLFKCTGCGRWYVLDCYVQSSDLACHSWKPVRWWNIKATERIKQIEEQND